MFNLEYNMLRSFNLEARLINKIVQTLRNDGWFLEAQTEDRARLVFDSQYNDHDVYAIMDIEIEDGEYYCDLDTLTDTIVTKDIRSILNWADEYLHSKSDMADQEIYDKLGPELYFGCQ